MPKRLISLESTFSHNNTLTGVYSDDRGATWTSFSSPLTQPISAIRGVSYGVSTNPKMVLVGFYGTTSVGRAFYSTNGIDWTYSSSFSGIDPTQVVFGNGTFLCLTGSEAGAILRSTNGETWETINSLPYQEGLTWSQLVHLGGSSWKAFLYDGSKIAVSTDNGSSWTLHDTSSAFSNLGSAAQTSLGIDLVDINLGLVRESTPYQLTQIGSPPGPSLTSMASLDSIRLITSNLSSPTRSRVFYSLDSGSTWTLTSLPESNKLYLLLRRGNSFLALGDVFYESYNGVDWFTRSTTGILNQIFEEFSVEYLTATATNSPVSSVIKLISSSKTATHSGSVSSYLSNKLYGNLWSFIYSLGKFIGVKAGSSTAATSTDGSVWIANTLPSSKIWSAIATDGTNVVAIAKDGTSAASSSNGTTWAARTLPSSRHWSSLSCKGTTFVAVAYQTNKCAKSSDGGALWTEFDLPQLGNWVSISNDGTNFVAITDSSVAAYSSDGETWTEVAMPANIHYNCVTWANNQFTAVASGPTDQAAKSLDGISWTSITMPTVANWTNVGPGVGEA